MSDDVITHEPQTDASWYDEDTATFELFSHCTEIRNKGAKSMAPDVIFGTFMSTFCEGKQRSTAVLPLKFF